MINNNRPPKKSRQFQEKINYYLTIVALVLFMCLPPLLCSLFYLSQVPDISWQADNSPAYTRIWLYRERRPVGIGYQSRRIVEHYSDTELCVENKLRFFLWGRSGRAEPATSRLEMIWSDNHWQSTGQEC